MYAKVCPLCNSKFYSAKKEISLLHNECGYKKLKGKDHRFRTSTPVSEIENVSSSFSDSVLDFFYQTWKNGLCANVSSSSHHRNVTIEASHDKYNRNGVSQRAQVQHPMFWYSSSQVVYFSTVVCQTVMPSGVYLQPVGYRPDGTFGVLPYFWPCVLQ